MQGNEFKIPAPRAASAPPNASPDPKPGRVPTASRSPQSISGAVMLSTAMLLLLAYFSSADAAFFTQIYLSGGLLVALLLFKSSRDSPFARVAFTAISSFLVLRYFFWRTLYTVEYTEWRSFSCALLLYMAEFYGIVVTMIGNFVNVFPLDRAPVKLPETGELPTVDVFVPSYNESTEMLQTTLMGALQMGYQEGKKTVYLLDDGGTDQKCQDGSEASRLAAQERRKTLQEVCEELGAIYLTRAQNRGAKAGNVNSAIGRTKGDLIVILDADHVPTEDFLEKTVGLFLEDSKLFLVQTPHFFINPDPIEKNLDTFRSMPSENAMFYQVIQKGLDFWNSAFFCGSGAVMRRRCLELIGGLSGTTITEDAETALMLHAKGFNSAYISTPLLSGLAPETMSAFISQRSRWAQGMIQIFLLKCPLFISGLTFPQRLCYFNSCFFWLFPFARIIYMLAPAAFLIFGLQIYAANFQTFCSYAIPYMVTMMATSNYLYGRVRWSFVSELYELIQSIHTIPGIIATFISPRAPTFKVTPKGEHLSEDFISPVATPFYILAAINFFSVSAGVYKLVCGDDQIYPVAITLFWSAFNTIMLMATMGALFERRQRRSSPRVDAGISAELVIDENVIACQVEDLSLGGCKLKFHWGSEKFLTDRSRGIMRVLLERDKTPTDFHIQFRNYREGPGDEFAIGVQFTPRDLAEKKAKVRLVTGSSSRWVEFQKNRESTVGVTGGFIRLTLIGFTKSMSHFIHIWTDLFEILTGREKKPETPA